MTIGVRAFGAPRLRAPSNDVSSCQRGRLWRRDETEEGGTVRLNPQAGTRATDIVVFPAESTEGPGPKLFFDPQGPSLRAGEVTGAQWDVVNRGADSVAFGFDTVASGAGSMAIGSGAIAAHSGSFVWSDSNSIASSIQNNETTFGTDGGFRVLSNGPGTPAYTPGDIYLDATHTVVTGKLTVKGLIDSTGLQCQQQLISPVGAVASTGTYWVMNGAPTIPMFTDSFGIDFILNSATPVIGAFVNIAGTPNVTGPNITSSMWSSNNDFVFGSQQLDDSSIDGDARFLFDKSKAAFRAGEAQADQWDDVNRGIHSIGLGLNPKASGDNALAAGNNSQATNDYSFVWSDSTPRVSANNNEITFGADGGFRVLGLGGGGPDYVPGQIYLDAADTIVTGKLTVTGIIDPTGLELVPQLSNPGSPGQPTIWVGSTGNELMFTDAGGKSVASSGPGSGVWEIDQTNKLVRPDAVNTAWAADNSFVFGSQELNDTGSSVGDTRFLFEQPTGAFRAGTATGLQWNTRGANSVAFGTDNSALGLNCVALGSSCVAGGNNSFVAGTESDNLSFNNTFVWSDGTVGRVATVPDEVTFGSAGGFRVLGAGGTGPAYVANSIYLDAASTVVRGSLSIAGSTAFSTSVTSAATASRVIELPKAAPTDSGQWLLTGDSYASTNTLEWTDGLSAPVSTLTQAAINRSLHTTATGVSQGGVLSINVGDNGLFDISSGSGYVVNGHTNVEIPISTFVSWTTKTGIVPAYLASHNASYIGLDISGNVYQSPVKFTSTERRNIIGLGLSVHPNRTSIFIINNFPFINVEVGAQVQDILSVLGFRSVGGNRILPRDATSTLQLKKEAGTAFKPGANFDTLITQPHFFQLPEQLPVIFRYRTQTGAEGSNITSIDPGIYDLNGTITAIPSTATLASVQQIYIFQRGDVRIQPGQKYYSNLSEAALGINSGYFKTEENIAANGLYLGSICMTRNGTNLNNIQEFIFVPSQGTTTNGSIASPPLGYTAENQANKQLTLVPDNTGVKYPSISALQAQVDITTTSSLSDTTIGKQIFFNPTGSITITVTASTLYDNHVVNFINESAYTVTFSQGASTTFNPTTKGFVLQVGGSGKLIRKGTTNLIFIDILNP
jgi:hypothetical protein